MKCERGVRGGRGLGQARLHGMTVTVTVTGAGAVAGACIQLNPGGAQVKAKQRQWQPGKSGATNSRSLQDVESQWNDNYATT